MDYITYLIIIFATFLFIQSNIENAGIYSFISTIIQAFYLGDEFGLMPIIAFHIVIITFKFRKFI